MATRAEALAKIDTECGERVAQLQSLCDNASEEEARAQDVLRDARDALQAAIEEYDRRRAKVNAFFDAIESPPLEVFDGG